MNAHPDFVSFSVQLLLKDGSSHSFLVQARSVHDAARRTHELLFNEMDQHGYASLLNANQERFSVFLSDIVSILYVEPQSLC